MLGIIVALLLSGVFLSMLKAQSATNSVTTNRSVSVDFGP
jgi:hypothetical protein